MFLFAHLAILAGTAIGGTFVSAEIMDDTGVGHNVHYVDAYPVFYNVKRFPAVIRTLSDGDDNVFTVTAEAVGGEVVIEHLVFDMYGTDVDDNDWMEAAEETYSALVSVTSDGDGGFDLNSQCFGLCYGDTGPTFMVRSGVDSLQWDIELTSPVTLEEGETADFTIVVDFGEDGLMPSTVDSFRVNLEFWAGWYGPDNSWQPEDDQLVSVFGQRVVYGYYYRYTM